MSLKGPDMQCYLVDKRLYFHAIIMLFLLAFAGQNTDAMKFEGKL